jgi:hypothetical protein
MVATVESVIQCDPRVALPRYEVEEPNKWQPDKMRVVTKWRQSGIFEFTAFASRAGFAAGLALAQPVDLWLLMSFQ